MSQKCSELSISSKNEGAIKNGLSGQEQSVITITDKRKDTKSDYAEMTVSAMNGKILSRTRVFSARRLKLH